MRNLIPATNHPTSIHINYYFCYCHEVKMHFLRTKKKKKRNMPLAQFDSVLRKFRI